LTLTKTVLHTYSHVPSTLEITNTKCWQTKYKHLDVEWLSLPVVTVPFICHRIY